jgi:hypothetical protein
MPDSAAAQAGIKAGDLITEFAGSPVHSTGAAALAGTQGGVGQGPGHQATAGGPGGYGQRPPQAPPAAKEKCGMDDRPRLGT